MHLTFTLRNDETVQLVESDRLGWPPNRRLQLRVIASRASVHGKELDKLVA